MSRVKRGKQHVQRRNRLLKKTKGYKWGRKNLMKLAHTAVLKAGRYAYRDRRTKKRNFRQLWQIKIGAACHQEGISYSKFIFGLRKNKIELDRKILADLAENHPTVFKKIVETAKK